MAALVFSGAAASDNDQAWEQLVWDFSGFVDDFESRHWEGVFSYVTEDSKIGFGGEQGIEGVRQVYVGNTKCFKDMLLALKQGCRKRDKDGGLACDAPPQWNDSSVVYLGARAGFAYSNEHRKWVVDYLICGGD